MARLPQPGGDNGQWGTILNDYLTQSHNADGSLKSGIVAETNLTSAVVTKLNSTGSLPDGSVTTTKLADGAVTNDKLDGATVTALDATIGTPARDRANHTGSQAISTIVGLDDHLGNVRMIKGAGIDPSGATSSLSAVSALIATAAEGDIFCVPSGAILAFDDTLTITNTRITITGSGELRWTSGIATKAAVSIQAAHVTLDGLHITNPNELGATTGLRNYGVEIKAHNTIVRGCTIEKFQNGISNRSDGEWYNTQILNNRILEIVGVSLEDRGDGININGAAASVIGNVVTCKAGTQGRVGIHAEALGTSIVTPGPYDNAGITFSGNIVRGPFRRSCVFENISDGTITGNFFADALWWELALIRTRSCVVSGNTMVRTASHETVGGSQAKAMIYVYGETQNCTVTGNALRLALGAMTGATITAFIAGESGSVGSSDWPTDCIVQGNNMFLSDDTPTDSGLATNGIWFSKSTRLTIENNHIVGASSRGIWSAYAVGCVIRGNRITGNVGDHNPDLATGIESSGSSVNMLVEDNWIESTTSKAIKLYNQAGDTIVRSNIIRQGNQGIDLFGCAGGEVKGNFFASTTTRYGTIPSNFAIDNVQLPWHPIPVSGCIAETVPRTAGAFTTSLSLTSGSLFMVGIWLPARTTITTISIRSGSTSLSGGSHAWAALFDSSRGFLAQSTDDTAPAWTGSTVKTFTLSTPYTTTYEGLYYIGLSLVATTMPTLSALAITNAVLNLTPIVCGPTSDSGLTATAPSIATAPVPGAGIPYAYLS